MEAAGPSRYEGGLHEAFLTPNIGVTVMMFAYPVSAYKAPLHMLFFSSQQFCKLDRKCKFCLTYKNLQAECQKEFKNRACS